MEASRQLSTHKDGHNDLGRYGESRTEYNLGGDMVYAGSLVHESRDVAGQVYGRTIEPSRQAFCFCMVVELKSESGNESSKLVWIRLKFFIVLLFFCAAFLLLIVTWD
jgi:hypothetical protein